jgi:hypothetical protein
MSLESILAILAVILFVILGFMSKAWSYTTLRQRLGTGKWFLYLFIELIIFCAIIYFLTVKS